MRERAEERKAQFNQVAPCFVLALFSVIQGRIRIKKNAKTKHFAYIYKVAQATGMAPAATGRELDSFAKGQLISPARSRWSHALRLRS